VTVVGNGDVRADVVLRHVLYLVTAAERTPQRQASARVDSGRRRFAGDLALRVVALVAHGGLGVLLAGGVARKEHLAALVHVRAELQHLVQRQQVRVAAGPAGGAGHQVVARLPYHRVAVAEHVAIFESVTAVPRSLVPFSSRLAELGWVTDLWIAGSLATGDYVPGVSDIDLVAIVDGQIDRVREAALVAVHEELDGDVAADADLGCVYVEECLAGDPDALHPTWTHGVLVRRILSGITRAELVRHGSEVFGRAPTRVLAPMTDDDVRDAARAEVCGYWAWASRRPWMWLSPVIAELGLTGMARARYALRTGRLLTKTEAIEQAQARRWLIDQLRARRRGEVVTSPRLRTAWIAWRDARRTVRSFCGTEHGSRREGDER
jgi:hypothetical protein